MALPWRSTARSRTPASTAARSADPDRSARGPWLRQGRREPLELRSVGRARGLLALERCLEAPAGPERVPGGRARPAPVGQHGAVAVLGPLDVSDEHLVDALAHPVAGRL